MGKLSIKFHMGLIQLGGQFTPRQGKFLTDSDQLTSNLSEVKFLEPTDLLWSFELIGNILKCS